MNALNRGVSVFSLIAVASTSILKELQEHAIKIQKGFKKMSGKDGNEIELDKYLSTTLETVGAEAMGELKDDSGHPSAEDAYSFAISWKSKIISE
jgi:hypothetical protein